MDERYQRFVDLCEKKGVTAYKVAKETGITTATLSNWKCGRYAPKADKMQKIADYFGVSLSYLMTGEDDAMRELLEQNEAEMERLHRAAFRPEMEMLIDVVKDAPDDVLIRLRYYAEGLMAGRKEST